MKQDKLLEQKHIFHRQKQNINQIKNPTIVRTNNNPVLAKIISKTSARILILIQTSGIIPISYA